ncbi:hypothetical protein BR93DRAFT_929367 [Coniochaeta sp. PMI_546]|nr:hypothetical protein BR93DRAFT_929367 [Coniochaeta sp. PMI_546]
MKTCMLLAAAAFLAPVFGAAVASKPQLNQYRNMNDCNERRDILRYYEPSPDRCYDMDDEAGAFYYSSGGRYDPYVYPERGCGGNEYNPRGNGDCYDRGNYRSFKMRDRS